MGTLIWSARPIVAIASASARSDSPTTQRTQARWPRAKALPGRSSRNGDTLALGWRQPLEQAERGAKVGSEKRGVGPGEDPAPQQGRVEVICLLDLLELGGERRRPIVLRDDHVVVAQLRDRQVHPRSISERSCNLDRPGVDRERLPPGKGRAERVRADLLAQRLVDLEFEQIAITPRGHARQQLQRARAEGDGVRGRVAQRGLASRGCVGGERARRIAGRVEVFRQQVRQLAGARVALYRFRYQPVPALPPRRTAALETDLLDQRMGYAIEIVRLR